MVTQERVTVCLSASRRSYPARSRAFYAGRLTKYLVAQSLLNPALFGAAVRAIKAAGGKAQATE